MGSYIAGMGFYSIEEEDFDNGEDPKVTENQLEATSALVESEGAVNDVSNALADSESADADIENMEKIADTVKDVEESGGTMDPGHAKVVELAVENFKRKFNIKDYELRKNIPVASNENFDVRIAGRDRARRNTVMTFEGIGSMLETARRKAIQFYQWIRDLILKAVDWVFKTNSYRTAQANDLLKMLRKGRNRWLDKDGTVWKEAINAKIAKNLMAGNKLEFQEVLDDLGKIEKVLSVGIIPIQKATEEITPENLKETTKKVYDNILSQMKEDLELKEESSASVSMDIQTWKSKEFAGGMRVIVMSAESNEGKGTKEEVGKNESLVAAGKTLANLNKESYNYSRESEKPKYTGKIGPDGKVIYTIKKTALEQTPPTPEAAQKVADNTAANGTPPTAQQMTEALKQAAGKEELSMWEKIKKFFVDSKNKLVEWTSKGWNTVWGWAKSAYTWISGHVTSLGQWISKKWNAFLEWCKNLIGSDKDDKKDDKSVAAPAPAAAKAA